MDWYACSHSLSLDEQSYPWVQNPWGHTESRHLSTESNSLRNGGGGVGGCSVGKVLLNKKFSEINLRIV